MSCLGRFHTLFFLADFQLSQGYGVANFRSRQKYKTLNSWGPSYFVQLDERFYCKTRWTINWKAKTTLRSFISSSNLFLLLLAQFYFVFQYTIRSEEFFFAKLFRRSLIFRIPTWTLFSHGLLQGIEYLEIIVLRSLPFDFCCTLQERSSVGWNTDSREKLSWTTFGKGASSLSSARDTPRRFANQQVFKRFYFLAFFVFVE